MKCASCGGDNDPQSAVCQYCGSRLGSPKEQATAAVFARINASPQWARSSSPERHAALPKHGAAQKAFLFIFFAVFIGFALVMAFVALGMAGLFGFAGREAGGGAGMAFSLVPCCFAVIPLAFVAFGVYMFSVSWKKMRTLETAPVVAAPVIILDKRTHVSGGSGNSRARTQYFVTCQYEDGNRKEHPVWDGAFYGRLTTGDGGVLFLRADHALDFDRVT